MYPPFLTSTLTSKRTTLIKIWKVLLKKSIHQLLRDFHTTRSLSLLWKSSWHLRPPSQRSILNSWIIYQSLHLDSSIASHIHPKRMYWLKLSLRVLSVSRFTVLPVASLLSVKRVSLSTQLPKNRLGSKLLSNTGRFSTTLLCRLHISVLQCTQDETGYDGRGVYGQFRDARHLDQFQRSSPEGHIHSWTPPSDPPEGVLSDLPPFGTGQLESSHLQYRSAPKGVRRAKAVDLAELSTIPSAKHPHGLPNPTYLSTHGHQSE